MQDFYTFDRLGNVLDGPYTLAVAEAVLDNDLDAFYVDVLEDELDDIGILLPEIA